MYHAIIKMIQISLSIAMNVWLCFDLGLNLFQALTWDLTLGFESVTLLHHIPPPIPGGPYWDLPHMIRKIPKKDPTELSLYVRPHFFVIPDPNLCVYVSPFFCNS